MRELLEEAFNNLIESNSRSDDSRTFKPTKADLDRHIKSHMDYHAYYAWKKGKNHEDYPRHMQGIAHLKSAKAANEEGRSSEAIDHINKAERLR